MRKRQKCKCFQGIGNKKLQIPSLVIITFEAYWNKYVYGFICRVSVQKTIAAECQMLGKGRKVNIKTFTQDMRLYQWPLNKGPIHLQLVCILSKDRRYMNYFVPRYFVQQVKHWQSGSWCRNEKTRNNHKNNLHIVLLGFEKQMGIQNFPSSQPYICNNTLISRKNYY